MKNSVRFVVFTAALTAATSVAAQAPPAGKPQPAKPQTPAVAPDAKPQQPDAKTPGEPAVEKGQPAPAPAYSYDPQGRRDPFVSLLSRGSEERPTGARAAGVHGLLIGEVTVKGIVRDRTGFIAMIQGPDTKTFIVRSGEKLMDGTVKAITADSVVFSQDVNDPLSMVKQKEVRKTVRSSDGGRG
jgi:Tfp pilus assembly protein PilP